MAIKSFQAKIICESASQREYLELTHRLFNESVAKVLPILYAAYRGKHGPEFRSVLRSIKSAQTAKEQVETITSLKSKPGEGEPGSWKQTARKLLEDGRILFDREQSLPRLGSQFRRKVFETCFQIILGHVELRKLWTAEHTAWCAAKAKFITDHPEYFAVRPIITEFQAAEGQAAKRRGRWHRWLSFLSANPALAAWRGGDAIVNALTDAELAAARKDRRRGVAKAFELFWVKNPELAALDRTHIAYEREFVRPWTKRRHHDGFKVPPSFTVPSIAKHPAWFQFKKRESYRNLDLQVGCVELKLITSATSEGRNPKGTVSVKFAGDSRMREFDLAPQTTIIDREKCELVYRGNTALGPRPATVKGIKLVYRKGQPYLYFTCFVADVPSRIKLKQSHIDKYGPKWASRKIVEELGQPPRTMAVDLGIRHIAVATIMEGDKLLATRFVHNRPRSYATGQFIDGIPSLGQIAAMKRELRQQRRRRGKPVKNQDSCQQLQHHLRRMSEDRFKKCAVAIADVARHHGVDVVVVEKLAGLIPDAARERGINSALVSWNRGQLVAFLQMLCEEQGLRVAEVAPHWTSHICSKCGACGQRYAINDGQTRLGPVEKLFGCPACGYRCNADFNASLNLHRVFLGTFPKVESAGKDKCRVNGVLVDRTLVRRSLELALTTPF